MPSGTVTSIGLNLRQQPDPAADVIAILTKNMVVDIITMNDDDSWYLVSADVDRETDIGWVNALYINASGVTPSGLPSGQRPVPGTGGTAADRMFAAKAPGVMDGLIHDFGLDEVQAAGILGNLGHECGGFTIMQELHPVSGRGGYGWAQWTGPRRVAFEAWCGQHSLSPNSDAANYGYLKYELQGEYRSTIIALKQTNTIEAAVSVFEQDYERAGVVALTSRCSWAQKAWNAYQVAHAEGSELVS